MVFPYDSVTRFQNQWRDLSHNCDRGKIVKLSQVLTLYNWSATVPYLRYLQIKAKEMLFPQSRQVRITAAVAWQILEQINNLSMGIINPNLTFIPVIWDY